MKTIKTLLITVITAFSWSSLSQTDLPNWYINLLKGNRLVPVVIRQPDGYAVRSSYEPHKISKKRFKCHSRNMLRSSYEGIFVEITPSLEGGYVIRYCEPIENIEARSRRQEQEKQAEQIQLEIGLQCDPVCL